MDMPTTQKKYVAMSQTNKTPAMPTTAPSATTRNNAYQRGVTMRTPALAPSSMNMSRCGSGTKDNATTAARANTRCQTIFMRLVKTQARATTAKAEANHAATGQEKKLSAVM